MKLVNTSAKLFVVLMGLSLASVAQNGKYDDDVYYSPSKAQSDKENNPQPSQSNTGSNVNDYSAPQQSQGSSDSRFDYSNTEQREPSSSTTEQRDGNTYVTNNYYDEDDYYDYYYASRIRRFHRPLWGYSYYDPFYTNSYWYDYNPYNWGTSIYLGYNWWAPSAWYSPSYCSFGYGYNPWNGWGWSIGWGYNPWNSWSGYGWNGGYHNGYANGYWNGYYDGYNNGLYNGYYNPYYFNSYDQLSYNNVYYGPRRTSSTSNKTANTPRSVGQNYYQALNKDVKNTLPVSSTFASTYSIPRPIHSNNNTLETANPKNNTGSVKPVRENNGAEGVTPKNNTGGVKPVRGNDATEGVTPKNNTGGVKPIRGNDNGADVNPAPVKGNDTYTSPGRPKSNSNAADTYTPAPKNNSTNDVKGGGEVAPTPRNNNVNPDPRPRNNYENSTPRNNNDVNSNPRPRNNYENSTPKNNNDYNSAPRPRNNYENSNPAPRPSYSEPSRPKNETPKSFESPRPRQERNVTTPSPSRPSNNNSAPIQSNEQKRGGR